jgi:glycosyltransferase involved in cell wall biosynthesis
MLSVVIPAYNEEGHIAKCLESLAQQETNQPFEVIVVDNASTDRTAEIARSYGDRLNLTVLREPKKGRGAARAAGFEAANGEIIFSTDGDTVVPPHWISALLKAWEKHPEAAALSGPIRITDCGPVANSLFNMIQPVAMVLYMPLFGHYWLTGSNFAIRRTAYLRAGGFDRDLQSNEDTDLSFRVKKVGKIRFVGGVPVVTSGRRFRGGCRGFLCGLFAYPKSWIQKFVLQRKDVELKDVR